MRGAPEDRFSRGTRNSVLGWNPVITKTVGLVVVVLEAVLSMRVVPRDNLVVLEYLTINGLSGVVLQMVELSVIILINNYVMRRQYNRLQVPQEETPESFETNYISKNMSVSRATTLWQEPNGPLVRISLNRHDSRELIRALTGHAVPHALGVDGNALDHALDCEEGLQLLVSSNKRSRKNSLSSITTV